MASVHVRPSLCSGGRCAVCHDDAVTLLDRCGSCGSQAHAECWRELPCCPTLACTGRFEPTPAPRVAPSGIGAGAFLIWVIRVVAGIGLAAALHQIGFGMLLGCFGGLALGVSWGPALERVGGWAVKASALAVAVGGLLLFAGALFTVDIPLGIELRDSTLTEIQAERIDDGPCW